MIRYEIKPLVIFSQHTEVYSVGLNWKGLVLGTVVTQLHLRRCAHH